MGYSSQPWKWIFEYWISQDLWNILFYKTPRTTSLVFVKLVRNWASGTLLRQKHAGNIHHNIKKKWRECGTKYQLGPAWINKKALVAKCQFPSSRKSHDFFNWDVSQWFSSCLTFLICVSKIFFKGFKDITMLVNYEILLHDLF